MSILSGRAFAAGAATLRRGLASLLVLSCVAGLAPPAQAAAPQAIAQGVPPTMEQFKPVLEQFGRFVYSERYGNVWQPSSLPPGWHPYPACHWAYDRSYGWTYDDQTAWGKIVHHYGRWAHDDFAGWVWIPGNEWSPAWVIWRTGTAWTGWAPTPPTTDQQETTLAAFNSDKQWTFIETAKIANRCEAEAAQPAATTTAAYQQTKLITNIKIVNKIAIFIFPPPPDVVVIDFDTGPIAPWSSSFLGDWVSLLSLLSSNAPIAFAADAGTCAPPVSPAFQSNPPPPPPGVPPKKQKKIKDTFVAPIDPGPPVIRPRRPPEVVIDPGPPVIHPRRPPVVIIDPVPEGPVHPRRPPFIPIDPGRGDGPRRPPRGPVFHPPGRDVFIKQQQPQGPVILRRRPRFFVPQDQGGGEVVR